MPNLFRHVLRLALDVIAPRFCPGCDEPIGQGDPFCASCDASIEPIADLAPLDCGLSVVSSGVYGGALARAIQAMKYEDRADLAAPLGRRLAKAFTRADFSGSATLVPVPLHPKRLAERGYNQSALIARALGRELGWNVCATALGRRRDTSAQARLGRSQRLHNVDGALIERARLDGKHVVLVDDVVTTGATASACKEALERAGAVVLAVAAVART
jgi:ComF family protein